MPFNGSGTFERAHNWSEDADSGIPIEASRMDAEDNGFATGLSTCVTKDGQTTPTANLPMGGFRHTSVGNASARNQYAAVGQVQDGAYSYAATTGSSNAYVLTLSPAISAYAAGQMFNIRANHTNNDAATLNVSGLGAKDILRFDGSAVGSGDIVEGRIYTLIYNGTAFVMGGFAVTAASTDAAGIVELATDAETQAGTDDTRAVTPAGLQSKVASVTAQGIVELATDAETQAGTDDERAVTPAGLQSKEASTEAIGLVELATNAEAAVGTADDKVLTASNRGALLGLSDGQHAGAGNVTLALTDAGKRVRNNSASARTVTVPPNSSVAFAVGTIITLARDGTGTFAVVEGDGVTVNFASGMGLSLRAQYSYGGLIKVGTNEWHMVGDVVT